MKINGKKILSLLLAISLLLTLSPVTPVAAEETTTAPPETTLSTPEETTETDALAAAPAIDLTADCGILNYVDEEVFAAGNHVLRLPEEETLSSYVFLNADGTKTVYYLDEAVKFVDSEGMIQEKDVTLALSGTAYTTTRNDVSLSIPTDPANGITLIWNGHAVRIIPQGGTLSDTVLDGNSIRYTDYYGEGADLVYTPTLTGVKEDIVLESYTGQNTFTFMLNTGGLNLYSLNGRYYLAESKTATDRIELGDLVTFDANGRFSVGTMTSQTITAGNIYRLTLKVDEAFLTDPETTYPVSIDPTIRVSDDTTEGSIEDVNVYEGTPNANADWVYMHVGNYDDTYGVGRILVRLTGLINDEDYQSVEADEILTAYFYLKEATGKAAANINLYPHRGNSNWTESSITWNTAGHTVGDIVTTVSHPRSGWGCYDIKSLLVDWKTGINNENSGFVLRHSDEANATKGFYSSEYSTTDYRPYVVVTYTASVSQPISNGTYYINNLSTGKYIKYATSAPVGASGLIADIGNSIRWQIAWTGEAYTIRLASSPTKYLAVPTSTSSSSVETVTVSDGATVPERCLWTITPGAYRDFRLQSVYNSRYLASNNTVLYTSTTTPQASYNTYIWRFANVSSFRELSNNFVVNNVTLDFAEPQSVTITRDPEAATWTNPGDFEYAYVSGDRGCITNTTFTFSAVGIGTAIYRATHKVTGLSSIFIVTVNTLPIYQTKATYYLDDEIDSSSGSEDLEKGDMSKSELCALSWVDWTDFLQQSQDNHITNLNNAAKLYSSGSLETVALDMVDHFLDGSGSEYSNAVLTDAVVAHESTTSYVSAIKSYFDTIVVTNSGDLSVMAYSYSTRDDNPLVNMMSENKTYNPVFDTTDDLSSGLEFCVHGLHGVKIEVTSFSVSDNSYTCTLNFTLYDHFGLDQADVEKYGLYPGFVSWYVLQHYDVYNGVYSPFVTLIQFSETFSGTM